MLNIIKFSVLIMRRGEAGRRWRLAVTGETAGQVWPRVLNVLVGSFELILQPYLVLVLVGE